MFEARGALSDMAISNNNTTNISPMREVVLKDLPLVDLQTLSARQLRQDIDELTGLLMSWLRNPSKASSQEPVRD